MKTVLCAGAILLTIAGLLSLTACKVDPADGPPTDAAAEDVVVSEPDGTAQRDSSPDADAAILQPDSAPDGDASISDGDSPADSNSEDWGCVRLDNADGGPFCRCSVPPPTEGTPIPESECKADQTDPTKLCRVCGSTCDCYPTEACTDAHFFTRSCERNVLCEDRMNTQTGDPCVLSGVECFALHEGPHLCRCDSTMHFKCDSNPFLLPDAATPDERPNWTGEPCTNPGYIASFACGDLRPGQGQWDSLNECVCEPSFLWYCFDEAVYTCGSSQARICPPVRVLTPPCNPGRLGLARHG